MDPARWRQVQEVFHQTLASPDDQRDAVLTAATQGDRELRSQVEALLDAHGQATTFVDRPAFRVVDETPEEAGDELPVAIGPYRPLEVLGRGGMGVVYRAVRADETFEKQVALKVVSRDLTTPDLANRFRAERQILADLEHPGIARLLDGGTTDDGRPYLVMEYVDGLPVDRFLAERAPSLEARLDLFSEICRAVHTAHQNLVVHRDLKPANILVTAEGRPKLLDFGIAKLLAPGGALVAPEVTEPGSRLMTPSYASPEQVRGAAVTTASDVYALGVLLYEMLTGRRPHGDRQTLPHELAQAILEEPATRPSKVLLDRAETDPSSQRPTRRLAKALRGDLDLIVLTALRKEPERRYPSAEAMAADIERFHRGLPLAARPDTFSYRAGKFVRRNRFAVAATLLIFAALSTLTMTTLVQRTEAIRQLDRAEEVSGFLIQLFQNANPRYARGKEITARELLDQGTRELTGSRQTPESLADLKSTMGEAYLGLGEYEPAGDLLDQALDHRRRRHGEEHAEVAASLSALGRLRLAEGDFEAAEDFLRRALTQRRSLFGPSHSLTGKSSWDLATLLHRRGNIEEADVHFREAIAIHRTARDDRERLGQALSGLSALERDRGHYEAAEALQREALESMIAARGTAPDSSIARCRTDLGTLLRRQGDDAGAKALYDQALATQRQLYPDGHPAIAVTLTHLASVATRQGNYEEADALYEEALGLRLRLLGDGHPLVANTLSNRAILANDLGQLDRAEELYRQALAIQEAALPDGHKDLASTRSNLGQLLADRGRTEQAEVLHRQALAAYRALYGDRHARVAVVLNNLAESLKKQQRYAEAKPLFEESVATLRAVLGDDHPNLAFGLNNLASVYQAENERESAASAYREARTIAEKRLGMEHPATLRITLNELSLAAGIESPAIIKPRLERFLERCEAALAADHPTAAEARDLKSRLESEGAQKSHAVPSPEDAQSSQGIHSLAIRASAPIPSPQRPPPAAEANKSHRVTDPRVRIAGRRTFRRNIRRLTVHIAAAETFVAHVSAAPLVDFPRPENHRFRQVTGVDSGDVLTQVFFPDRAGLRVLSGLDDRLVGFGDQITIGWRGDG